MTLNLSLNPTLEAKLREQAQATGKSLERLVAEAVEEKLTATNINQHSPQNTTSQSNSWSTWVEGMKKFAQENLHPGHTVDDSRQSIYSGRGE